MQENKKVLSARTARTAFLATLPVLAGYLVLGMGFGMIMRSRGFGPLWAAGMSIFIYAGSMQYVAIDLITGGASLVAMALTTLMVNARHLFYGISMVESYKHTRYRPFLIFTLTDETYSLVADRATVEANENPQGYCLFVSLFNYLYWIVGSVLGALLGGVLPFSTEGIDFALTALFLTVFVEQWLSERRHTPALIGLFASLVARLLFGPDNFLILAMAFILVLLLFLGRREVKGRD